MTAPSHEPQLAFSSLPLPDLLKRGIEEAGFKTCTPIQAQTLPIALTGRDVAGQAQTGTGKTATFLIAMMNRLLSLPARADRTAHSPRGFILAPTRELAIQIHKDALSLGRHTGLVLGLAFGGVDYEKQRLSLAHGVDILIGTPGRIIDFYKQHVFDLKYVEAVVLDEADRMFDLGFISDIRYLMRKLPPANERLSMLFSATLSQRVLELAFEHMNDPIKVSIEPEKVTADRVKQVIYFPAMNEKSSLLLGLLQQQSMSGKTMVFCNMKRTVERLEHILVDNGIDAKAMSGDVPQNKRLRMLNDFHSGQLKVLIATDVAARGLHIPDVTHVYNYDLPQDPEDYVHRIGRTARAGASGDAISFGCEDTVEVLPDIERYIGNKIPVATIEPSLLVPVIEKPYAPKYSSTARPSRARRPNASSHTVTQGTGQRPRGQPGAKPYPGQAQGNHKKASGAPHHSGQARWDKSKRHRHRQRPQPTTVSPSVLPRAHRAAWIVGAVALTTLGIGLFLIALQ